MTPRPPAGCCSTWPATCAAAERRHAPDGRWARSASPAPRSPAPTTATAHRRRRLLVQDLADTLAELDAARRLLVLLEDLHWADELSLDVRRPPRAPARRPARSWWSAPTAATSCTRDMPMRELAGPAADPAAGRGDPAAAADRRADRHAGERRPRPARAGPARRGAARPQRRHPAARRGAARRRRRPDSRALDATRDRRTSRTRWPTPSCAAAAACLDDDTRDVAAAAAVIGRSFDFDLLAAVTRHDAGRRGRRLRELQQVVPASGRRRTPVDVRLPARADPRRPLRRHRRCPGVAAARAGRPGRRRARLPRRVRVRALRRWRGCDEPAYRARAARRPARRRAMSAHRRGARAVPAGAAQPARPTPHRRTGRPARRARRRGGRRRRQRGRRRGVRSRARAAHRGRRPASPPRPWCRRWSRSRTCSATGLDSAGRPGSQRALASLDGVPDADPVRARLLAALAAAYMLDRRLEESIEYGERSRALSRAGRRRGDRAQHRGHPRLGAGLRRPDGRGLARCSRTAIAAVRRRRTGGRGGPRLPDARHLRLGAGRVRRARSGGCARHRLRRTRSSCGTTAAT